jgi:hypothetical protein
LFGAVIAAAGWQAGPGLVLAFTLLGLVLA